MSKSQKKQLASVKKKDNEYLVALNERNFLVSQAYIFGSYAKGRAHSGSDIDVCIVSREYNPDDDKIRLLLWQARREIDPRIEPVAYHPQDFKSSDPLVFEVKEYGLQISVCGRYARQTLCSRYRY